MVMHVDIMDLQKSIPKDAAKVYYKIGDHKHMIRIDRLKVGYGYRNYFICPECGARRTKLYLCNDRLICRKCGDVPVYRGIQNMTKGGDQELAYRMERFAKKHNIEFSYPFEYYDFLFDERSEQKEFRENLKIMQALENMRFQAIFQNKRYSSRVIRSVLSGNHPLLLNEYVTLQDLHDSLYDWGSYPIHNS